MRIKIECMAEYEHYDECMFAHPTDEHSCLDRYAQLDHCARSHLSPLTPHGQQPYILRLVLLVSAASQLVVLVVCGVRKVTLSSSRAIHLFTWSDSVSSLFLALIHHSISHICLSTLQLSAFHAPGDNRHLRSVMFHDFLRRPYDVHRTPAAFWRNLAITLSQ